MFIPGDLNILLHKNELDSRSNSRKNVAAASNGEIQSYVSFESVSDFDSQTSLASTSTSGVAGLYKSEQRYINNSRNLGGSVGSEFSGQISSQARRRDSMKSITPSSSFSSLSSLSGSNIEQFITNKNAFSSISSSSSSSLFLSSSPSPSSSLPRSLSSSKSNYSVNPSHKFSLETRQASLSQSRESKDISSVPDRRLLKPQLLYQNRYCKRCGIQRHQVIEFLFNFQTRS